MSGDVVQMSGNYHREAQSLLPWYVTGRLESVERAQVEAHLAGCRECQVDVELERGLQARVVSLRIDVEQGWARLRPRLEPERARRSPAARWRAPRGAASRWAGAGARAGSGWSPWAMAAQVCLAVVVVGALLLVNSRSAGYHLLGAAGPSPGNVVVMFRPQTSEESLRRVLEASHARLVDGPTSTGAWLLRVPAAVRDQTLARLRIDGDVTLAEPVDSAAPP